MKSAPCGLTIRIFKKSSGPGKDLLNAFNTLARCRIQTSKFCFFIDGLDEYDSDHKEILDLLDSFASASDIKIVVSSRPWIVFEDFYGDNAGQFLRVQDFTRPDIENFVTEKLTEDRRFMELEASDKGYSILATEIADRAHVQLRRDFVSPAGSSSFFDAPCHSSFSNIDDCLLFR